MTDIHVFLATDDNFVVHTATVMASILSNARLEDKLTFYVCSGKDLSAENKCRLEQMRESWDFDLNFPLPELNWQEPFKSVFMPPHINMNGFLRILIPWLCPEASKVIYLDSDVVVMASLAELYNTNVDDYYFAGTEALFWARQQKRLAYGNGTELYINSGMLVVNCDASRCNEKDYWERILAGIEKNGSNYVSDQDIINDCFYDKIKKVSYKWNFHHTHYWNKDRKISTKPGDADYPTDPADFAESAKNPSVIHYVSWVKPWTDVRYHPKKDQIMRHPEEGLYFKYRNKTPWELYSLLEHIGEDIRPTFPNNDSIMAFFACDQNNAALLNVAVLSLISRIKSHQKYDIIILESGFSDFQKKAIYSCGDNYENLTLRFINLSDVEKLTSSSAVFRTYGHVTSVAHWKTFAPYLFKHYETAVHLDADIIVEEDIFELKKYTLGDNLIGACRDFVVMMVSLGNSQFVERSLALMSLDIYNYFNAGILLLNLAKMREVNFKEELDNAHTVLEQPYFADQDILNFACKDRVTYLDPAWNNMSWTEVTLKQDMTRLPEEHFRAYQNAASAPPKIIHYAGGVKPAQRPDLEQSLPFWEYAKMTCWYEKFLFEMSAKLVSNRVSSEKSEIYNRIISRVNYEKFGNKVKRFLVNICYRPIADQIPSSAKQKIVECLRKIPLCNRLIDRMLSFVK